MQSLFDLVFGNFRERSLVVSSIACRQLEHLAFELELSLVELVRELFLSCLHFVLRVVNFIVLYPEVDEFVFDFSHYSFALFLELLFNLCKVILLNKLDFKVHDLPEVPGTS